MIPEFRWVHSSAVPQGPTSPAGGCPRQRSKIRPIPQAFQGNITHVVVDLAHDAFSTQPAPEPCSHERKPHTVSPIGNAQVDQPQPTGTLLHQTKA